ncbi:MAG: hypothetical protein LLG00_12430, partial [Planctomycetaceae bacterium]|nr:hypothetical protein [Planctomycetaceae bacterium]
TRLSQLLPTNPQVVTWVNPSSVQIFSAGRDGLYSQLTAPMLSIPPYVAGSNCLAYPTGENYGTNTFDDITNFSGGKLESKMP